MLQNLLTPLTNNSERVTGVPVAQTTPQLPATQPVYIVTHIPDVEELVQYICTSFDEVLDLLRAGMSDGKWSVTFGWPCTPAYDQVARVYVIRDIHGELHSLAPKISRERLQPAAFVSRVSPY